MPDQRIDALLFEIALIDAVLDRFGFLQGLQIDVRRRFRGLFRWRLGVAGGQEQSDERREDNARG